MDFTPGSIYSLDYGVVIKLATFSRKDGEYNFFFDKDGEVEAIDEDTGSVFISLRNCSKTDIRNCRSITFDDADELVQFILKQNAAADKKYNTYFLPRAFEIINENYIKFYYEMVVSFT